MIEQDADRQTKTLVDVLNLEARLGFNNGAVIGSGLDGMLSNLSGLAAVRNLPPMNGRRYSSLSVGERKAWRTAVLHTLQSSTHPATLVQTPKPKETPRAPRPVRRQPNSTRSQPSRKSPKTGLDREVADLRFLHRAAKQAFQQLGLATLGDVLRHFPLRHIDYSRTSKILELSVGDDATVVGEVLSSQVSRFGGRNRHSRVRISDGTEVMTITWFNMPYLADRWQRGDRIVVSGKISEFRGRPTMENPEYDDVTRGGRENPRGNIHAGAVVPVYPLSSGLNQRTVRNGVMQCLDNGIPLVEDPLPRDLISKNGLIPLADAITAIHRPPNDANQRAQQLWAAKRRLAFDEFLYNQIAAIRRRERWRKEIEAVNIDPDRVLVDQYLESLGFVLTVDQQESLDGILADMSAEHAMARLLQGEVGSGKTVVAIGAMLSVSGRNVKQSAMMVPTEVLAEQHFLSMLEQLRGAEAMSTYGPVYESQIFEVAGRGRNVRIGLLTGSMRERDKRLMQEMCAAGEVDLVVGTHALLQEGVDFADLALVVVDEQHRFGTEQRAVLTNRNPRPHMLSMSATPIPRTLHMTMYGEMELSTLRTMPRGRIPIETVWARTPMDVHEAYQTVRSEIGKGRQAFIVCPIIDPSDTLDAVPVTTEYERLRTDVFPKLKIGMLHGRMSLSEKRSVMDRFRQGDIDVLAATQVIEVGVDVPNATVMVIMSAHQFGLSQLHQIRGRVGRGEHASRCILISDTDGENAEMRLNALVEHADGFKLAERDLELRGPGRNLAEVQSGWSGWRFARFDDLELLGQARSTADRLLKRDADLTLPEHRLLRREAIRAIGRAVSRFS